MPTLLEINQPEVKERRTAARVHSVPLRPLLPAFSESASQRRLFSDSLLESDSPARHRRGCATTVSFAFQCVMLGVLLIMPLMFTEALPTQQLLTFLVAPPPPPPPPPPAAVPIAKVVQTDMLNSGQLRTPTRIPQKVEVIREEEAPPPMPGGVVGGVPGGIPGGHLGGVIGGIISSASTSTAAVAKFEPVKRIRISQGVSQGMLIHKVEPEYPKIALVARITGVVLLHAILSKEGTITELQVVSGHPLLISSAMDAVKQWRFRPYLLNGEPVEVETFITVTFQISD
jgi:periplasmic protein TonB